MATLVPLDRPDRCRKLSDLLTEAGTAQTVDDWMPHMDHLPECFGSGRLMRGSDWPVLDFRHGYGEWAAATQPWLAPSAARNARPWGRHGCLLPAPACHTVLNNQDADRMSALFWLSTCLSDPGSKFPAAITFQLHILDYHDR